MLKAAAILLALALLLAAPQAWGQGLTVMGPVADKIQLIASSIKERPSDWVITVTDEPTWQRLRLQWHSPSVTAFTETHGKVTYLRQRFAETGNPKEIRHVLAHEVAHLLLGTDEYKAEKWANDHRY